MKGMRYITVIVATMVAFAVPASDKKLDELISRLDVKNYVEFIDRGNPANFWNAISENDETFQKLCHDLEKEKSMALKAQKSIAEMAAIDNAYNNPICIQSYDSLMTILKDGLYANSPDMSISAFGVIPYYSPNAFASPFGKIFITDLMLERQNYDYNRLLGLAAHEMCHYILQHTFTRYYALNKRERRNTIIAAIGTTVVTAAHIYGAAKTAEAGITLDVGPAIADAANDFNNAAKAATENYHYEYSREQELQADIVAYRFLEWCGIGGEHYIEALKALQSRYSDIQESESDHPTTKYRIELLEYIHSGEYEPTMEKRYERMWCFLHNHGYNGLVAKEDFQKWICKDKNCESVYEALLHRGYPGLGSSKEFKKMVKGEVESIKYTDDIYR